MRQTTTYVLSVLAVCTAMPALAAVPLVGGSAPVACTPTAVSAAPGGRPSGVDGWDAEQIGNATTIVTVGAGKGVAPRGWVIAVATAIQESALRNLAGGDRDSIGLFQQRPSQGWGTPNQLREPAYQAGKFYDKLLAVPGWQQMPLTRAAQAVQISAYPDAYAEHEARATALVTHVGSAVPSGRGQCPSTCVVTSAAQAGGCVDAATVFTRARSWLTAWSGGPVPYLSSGDPGDWFQGYRRDCSGYVSMALGLEGPGLNTSGLAARSTVISKSALRPGDLLINTAPNLRGHVVLFERWADAAMTSYYGYEQTGSANTRHRAIPYPYFGDYPMVPYRFGTST